MDSIERDERVSWRIATTIMVVATIFTFVTWLIVTGPFTLIFDILMVYVPTMALVGWTIVERVRSPRNESAMAAGSTPENKVA